MSGGSLPLGAILTHLTETLSGVGRNEGLDASGRLKATLEAFMTTPLLQGLDPTFYEALLSWAGFDLREADDFWTAAKLTAIVTTAGMVSVDCGDGGGGCAVLELAESDAFRPVREWSYDWAESEEAIAMSRRSLDLLKALIVADDGPFPPAEAA